MGMPSRIMAVPIKEFRGWSANEKTRSTIADAIKSNGTNGYPHTL
jgi:hypothetical protein